MPSSTFANISHRHIDGLNIDCHEFEHRATGARHFHLACDDQNNAFMVAFPTLPTDSTGVAHILEHTTLCGSEKFPVRDPFFMMLRRSLNTYMNAFTSGDSTAYPFATQNRKDFGNLLAVYLDAVFFPLLDPLDFAQEGWRVEFEGDGDQSKLQFKGVVFNEMKGAMSAPSSQLWQQLHRAIFRDTVYQHNSGGEPRDIPDLSHSALTAFHKKHYHPSHATFMTYGNIPVEQHQETFESLALHKFGRSSNTFSITLQSRFAAPANVRSHYAVLGESEMERGTHAIWAWVIGNSAEAQTLLEGHLLAGLLLDNGASPLRQYLETTDLADSPSELCMLDDSACQLILCCGVEGTDEKNVDQINEEIIKLLNRIAAEGVDQDTLTGLLDQMEIAQRDIGGGGYPYGLQLMGRLLPSILHGGDPVDLIDLDGELATLRQRIKIPSFIPDMIRSRLIENPHHTRVVMCPDDKKVVRDNAAEKSQLAVILSKLDDTGRDAIRRESERLTQRQNEPQNAERLPKVTLDDVPNDIPRVALEQTSISHALISHCSAPTNGLCYLQIAIDLPFLDDDELVHLPLFCEYLTELGTGDTSYVVTQENRAKIGIYSAYASARASVDGSDRLHARLVITAKGLARKRSELVGTLFQILSSVRFDESNRLLDLISQSRVEVDASINERGHVIAIHGASGVHSAAGFLGDLWDGPANMAFVQQLDRRCQTESDAIEAVTACFERVRDRLLAAPWRAVIVAEKGVIDAALDQLTQIHLGQHEETNFVPFATTGRTKNFNCAWVTNTLVNCCARVYAAEPVGHSDAAALAVLAKYLQDGHLHPAIREKGGAYGAGAQFDPESTTFRFFSYRDPRLSGTLVDFDNSLDWLSSANDPQRLEESILGVVRSLDTPRTPAGAAIHEFYEDYEGRSHRLRVAQRNCVLETQFNDLVRVAAQYLVNGVSSTHVVTHSAHEIEIDRLELERRKL